jgi:hypothetical protein
MLITNDSVREPEGSLKSYFEDCSKCYLTDLEKNILPFWLEHGLDKVNGGFSTEMAALWTPQSRFGFRDG